MAVEIMCYNKGCGQKFDPSKNSEDACKFHPGGPIFHDALKGWSCCKKRSTDFTEFLNIPGCTTGSHTNEKPKEPEKAKPSEGSDSITETPPPQIIKKPEERKRPSSKEPMTKLSANVAASLKKALEKQMSEMNLTGKESESADAEVAVGTACKNSGCQKTYEGEKSNGETCQYHSGAPIFHEGMKYWSCCQRKTTDFNTFLSQEGCEFGKHTWIKKDDGEKKVDCRHDWHQTGSFVTISVFAKVCDPEKTVIEANKVGCKINIVFDKGESHFVKSFNLFGVIDPEKSSVKLLGTKVEINLKKGEAMKWSKLELEEK